MLVSNFCSRLGTYRKSLQFGQLDSSISRFPFESSLETTLRVGIVRSSRKLSRILKCATSRVLLFTQYLHLKYFVKLSPMSKQPSQILNLCIGLLTQSFPGILIRKSEHGRLQTSHVSLFIQKSSHIKHTGLTALYILAQFPQTKALCFLVGSSILQPLAVSV